MKGICIVAFENGFNPKEHFSPIVVCFNKNISLPDDILRITKDYIGEKNWPAKKEELYSNIQKLMQNDFAYSCLRQYILYDEDKVEQITGEKYININEIVLQDKYKDFFKQIKLLLRK